MSEAPKMIYVPTGILPSAIDRYEAGETTSLILTAFDTPVYEDDYAYRLASIPWLPEEHIAMIEAWPCLQQCTDGVIPHGPLADGSWEAEQCQFCDERERILNALKEGEK